jgi:hypothetical protein
MFAVQDANHNDGIPRVVLATDVVVLEFEWPDDYIDALPSDLTLAMSGDGVPTQTQALSAGQREDGLVRVSFTGIRRGQAVTITAKSGSTEVTLMQDHVVSDLDKPPQWLKYLSAFVVDEAPSSSPSPGSSGPAGGSSGNDPGAVGGAS